MISRPASWMFFIAVILVLLGLYAGVRTAVNIAFIDKYPAGGVIPIYFGTYGPLYQREEDCTYTRLYYKDDGHTTRPATEEEKAQEAQDTKNCLNGVREARVSAKVNDISTSLLFLFLGLGTLAAYKIFLKKEK